MPDGDDKFDMFQGLIVTYDNADLNIGLAYILRHGHRTAGQLGGVSSDQVLQVQLAYFKYNNGRFFANGEYAAINIDNRQASANTTLLPPGTAANIAAMRPNFIEGYHYMFELGTMVGPMKLSLIYAQASGNVLNDNNPTKTYISWPINWQAMEPYEMLMFYTYGGGNQTFNSIFVNDGGGSVADAYVYGGRVDYAVASNLNIWASYIWAHRLEVAGAFVGGINCNGFAGNANAAAATAWKILNGYGVSPYVDDGYLGWEVNAGWDWKLLEGLTFQARYAYWQPGDWFEQAWQAITVRGGATVANGILETRDAIHAFKGSFLVEF
jgi:hypothetical protein